MATSQYRSLPNRPSCVSPCPMCAAELCREETGDEINLDALPDEIDLVRVLWSQMRSYCHEALRPPVALS